MTAKYPDCFFCGGEVTERCLAREVWWQGRLHLIEEVPVGACAQCGQKVILPEVARAIDALLSSNLAPDHLVQVPAFSYRHRELAPA